MKSAAPSTLTVLTERYGPNHAFAPLIVPPDGGWGWVIVLTGFVAAVIMDGVSCCFYLFRDPMAHDLPIFPADVSFLSALFTGFYFMGGIVACSVGNYCGFRIVMVLGGTVLCLTFASGFVLSDIFYFFVIIGFIGGLAAGFIFVAGVLPTGFYFDKKRSIAMGLVSCGSGVGAIIVPQVTSLFMNSYGWRLTYLFHACLFVILIMMGFLVRPLKPVMVVIKPPSRTTLNTEGERRSSPIDFSLFRIPSQSADVGSIGASSIYRSVVPGLPSQPTISQVAQDIDNISIRVDSATEQSIIERLNFLSQSRDVQPSASILMQSLTIERLGAQVSRRRPWYRCGCCQSKSNMLPERPMLRTDLLYTGSLHRLDEYTTQEKHLDYLMNITKVPTYFENMQDLTRTYTYWCCHNVLNGIRHLLDYTLLKSPTFDCLALCGFANYIAFYLPFLYGKIHLEKLGKEEFVTTLVSMIGLGTMFGRISSGLIVTIIPRFGARTTVSFTAMIAGLSVISCTFYDHIYYQFGCMILYGFCIGFFAPLRSIIIVDFMGLNTLTSATGMMILFQGCGSFLGAPLAEAVLGFTKNDNSPFYLCGGALLFASMILWPMRILQKWEKKRKEGIS